MLTGLVQAGLALRYRIPLAAVPHSPKSQRPNDSSRVHEDHGRRPDGDRRLIERRPSRIGRIYSQQLQAGLKWHWSLEIAPASPPNQRIADTLEEAKAALARQYGEVKQGK
jgi:hypothetical protein